MLSQVQLLDPKDEGCVIDMVLFLNQGATTAEALWCFLYFTPISLEANVQEITETDHKPNLDTQERRQRESDNNRELDGITLEDAALWDFPFDGLSRGSFLARSTHTRERKVREGDEKEVRRGI